MAQPSITLSLRRLTKRTEAYDGIKKSTKASYLLSARQLTELLDTTDVLTLYRRAKETIDAVMAVQRWKLRTKYNHVTSMIGLAKHNLVRNSEVHAAGLAAFQDKCDDLRKERDASRDDKLPPKLQGLTWQDIVRVQEKLPSGSMEKLIVSMYTLIPPRRLEYATLLTKPPKEQAARAQANYLELGPGQKVTMVLNEYKTASKYATYTAELPSALASMILQSLKKLPRDYLLLTARNNPFGGKTPNNALGTRLSQILRQNLEGRPVTCTDLRKLYVSYHAPTMGLAARTELAKQMGHDAMTALAYYQKDGASKSEVVLQKALKLHKLVTAAAAKLSKTDAQLAGQVLDQWCDLAESLGALKEDEEFYESGERE